MRYDEKENGYKLNSGRTFYANRGIIGIDPELNISEGYDGGILSYDEPPFAPNEKAEIALEMINRWTQWAIKREIE